MPYILDSPDTTESAPSNSPEALKLGYEQGRVTRKRRATERYTYAIDRGYIKPSHMVLQTQLDTPNHSEEI